MTNPILELKGRFHQAPSTGRPGSPALPKGALISTEEIEHLVGTLEAVRSYWKQRSDFKPLLSICYKMVIAKSNRMAAILGSEQSINSMIVGAKFTTESSPKHIITYCCDVKDIENGLEDLNKIKLILDHEFGSQVTDEALHVFYGNEKALKRPLSKAERSKRVRQLSAVESQGLSKTRFGSFIRDIYYIDRFFVEEHKDPIWESQLITLYDVGLSKADLLTRLDLHGEFVRSVDDLTWMVTPDQYQKIIDRAPFLVAMSVTDIGRIDARVGKFSGGVAYDVLLPNPENEPIIGVIDTLFDERVYFSPWVEYHCKVSEILIEPADYEHGTAISSLIVDGPALNPHLEDGCGRFRVRHFGVAKHDVNSSATIMDSIRSIVKTNKDIKVWNLSLGSPLEIDANFISPEAMLLDQLQFEHDIIFIVAGTNKRDAKKSVSKIGAPADSINSLVVNASTLANRPAEYSRSGPVLHFFNKPDLATFGGDRTDTMVVHSSIGHVKKLGTSFATPWISRKMAYLIYKMGFPREVAKALLLHSARGWNPERIDKNLLGFGIVPTHIKDILSSEKGEIRFVLHGRSEAYHTYTYEIPVPMRNEKFPYLAKATLCYFPKCSRSQGVDYTDTEMDIQFGRIDKEREGRVKIRSIDNNQQGDDQSLLLFEETVRKQYRKWDNVKHISEQIKSRSLPRKRLNLQSTNWGISIKTKERLVEKSGRGLRFGLVVTLREMDGVNRIDEFIQLCRANGWFVNEVDIHTRVETYEKAEESLVFNE